MRSIALFFEAEHTRVGLSPDGIGVHRIRGRASRSDSFVVTPGTDDDWRVAVAALTDFLLQGTSDRRRLAPWPIFSRPGTLSVALSLRLLRFVTVPWSDDLLSPTRADDYLAGQFGAVFGPPPDTWLIAAEDLGLGQPRLACAVDRELIRALETVAGAAGAKLETVVPWPVAALNRFHHSLGDDGWLVLVEPGRLALVELVSGSARQINQQSWQEDWPGTLARSLRRATLRSGREAGLPVWAVDGSGLDSMAPDYVLSLPVSPCLGCDWPLVMAEMLS